MKVSDLKTALKRYGFDDTDPLLLWLNSAYHEIENAAQHWSFLEGEEELITNVNIFNLPGFALINRMIKLRDVTDELVGGSGVDLEFMDRREFQRQFSNSLASGNPEYYTILGSNKIQVYPDPTGNRNYKATFVKKLADLVGEAEEPAIPVANHYTIVRGAAYVALQAENEEERAASAQSQFESDLDKMIMNDQIRQIGEMATITDAQGYTDG